jgi:hypothetical protein
MKYDLSSYDKVYLDLDRTMFDTDAYVMHCATCLINHLGVDSIEFISETKKHSIIVDEKTYHYLMFGHCKHYGLNPVMAAEFLIDNIEPNMFIYPDILEFFASFNAKHKLEIVTFGSDQEQQFKIDVSPVLDGITAHISMRPKSEVLAEISKGLRAVIIDDKLIPNLPKNVDQIHITRGVTKSIASISDFSELRF